MSGRTFRLDGTGKSTVSTGEARRSYDRPMQARFRGGLKSPRIIRERVNKAMILSLVSPA